MEKEDMIKQLESILKKNKKHKKHKRLKKVEVLAVKEAIKTISSTRNKRIWKRVIHALIELLGVGSNFF